MKKESQEIKGSLNKKLNDITLKPVNTFETYFEFSQSLYTAIKLLTDTQDHLNRAMLFLAGQAVEDLLKAFLMKNGKTEGDVKKLSHNLCTLQNEVCKIDPSYHPATQDWLIQLNILHNKPYSLRYPPGSHGQVKPPIQSVLGGLQELFLHFSPLIYGIQ